MNSLYFQKKISYQNLALKTDLRIVEILLVAPEFSNDFVTDCEMGKQQSC
tara:strand:- start:285 stop:434 length:150 start_codon:yes stop_codon:yes gene_type:complete